MVVFMLEVKYYVYERKNDTYYTQNNTRCRKGEDMKIEFISNAFEHLKTAYYEDFFFQDVEVRDLENDRVLLTPDFQGKVLQLICGNY